MKAFCTHHKLKEQDRKVLILCKGVSIYRTMKLGDRMPVHAVLWCKSKSSFHDVRIKFVGALRGVCVYKRLGHTIILRISIRLPQFTSTLACGLLYNYLTPKLMQLMTSKTNIAHNNVT